MDDEAMMVQALEQARLGLAQGEVPIGCVVVKDGQVVGRGYNRKEQLQDPTAHAEVLALREAAATVGGWRLSGTTLYVTAEPCLMCLGAALQARVERIVYGCPEPRFGAVSLACPDGKFTSGNHTLSVRRGVLEQQCVALLRNFFAARRVGKPSDCLES